MVTVLVVVVLLQSHCGVGRASITRMPLYHKSLDPIRTSIIFRLFFLKVKVLLLPRLIDRHATSPPNIFRCKVHSMRTLDSTTTPGRQTQHDEGCKSARDGVKVRSRQLEALCYAVRMVPRPWHRRRDASRMRKAKLREGVERYEGGQRQHGTAEGEQPRSRRCQRGAKRTRGCRRWPAGAAAATDAPPLNKSPRQHNALCLEASSRTVQLTLCDSLADVTYLR